MQDKKNKQTLEPLRQGLKSFLPVPPKISLPITIPKEIPRATCHKGIAGGNVNGNNNPETRNPSLISCLRVIAKSTSKNHQRRKRLAILVKI